MEASPLELMRRSGLIAIVRCQAALDLLLEVGDALVASPAPVMAVSATSSEPATAIYELSQRFGQNMLVGVTHFAPVGGDLGAWLDAGARFVLAGRYVGGDAARCRRYQAAYLPCAGEVPGQGEALAADSEGVLLFPARRSGPARCRALVSAYPQTAVIAAGAIPEAAVGEYAQAGAAAVGIYGVLGAGAKWQMGPFIRRVRRLRSAWWDAQGTKA